MIKYLSKINESIELTWSNLQSLIWQYSCSGLNIFSGTASIFKRNWGSGWFDVSFGLPINGGISNCPSIHSALCIRKLWIRFRDVSPEMQNTSVKRTALLINISCYRSHPKDDGRLCFHENPWRGVPLSSLDGGYPHQVLTGGLHSG